MDKSTADLIATPEAAALMGLTVADFQSAANLPGFPKSIKGKWLRSELLALQHGLEAETPLEEKSPSGFPATADEPGADPHLMQHQMFVEVVDRYVALSTALPNDIHLKLTLGEKLALRAIKAGLTRVNATYWDYSRPAPEQLRVVHSYQDILRCLIYRAAAVSREELLEHYLPAQLPPDCLLVESVALEPATC